MSVVIELSPEMERQLEAEASRAGQDPATLVRSLLELQLNALRRERNERAIADIEQWLAEPPNEEDERWPELQAALEANRKDQRRLFGE